MTLKTLNQKGFSAIEALLILILVGIISGTGYYVYSANRKSNDNLESANNVSRSSSNVNKKDKTGDNKSKQSYLTIKEWHVRGVLSVNITPLYAIKSSGPETWAQLSSQQLVDLDPSCDVASQAGGIIARGKTADTFYSPSGESLGTVGQMIEEGTLVSYKKVGDYYYWIEQSQSLCSDKQNANDLQQQIYAAFKKSIDTFEAIP